MAESYYFRSKTIPQEQNYTFPFKVDNFILYISSNLSKFTSLQLISRNNYGTR